MLTETFVFETPCRDSSVSQLKMAAKRYSNTHTKARDGITILACHGLGQRQCFFLPRSPVLNAIPHADKEQWEPVIETLFRSQAHLSSRRQVREVWAFDWQTHGESAVLNQALIDADVKAARTRLQS